MIDEVLVDNQWQHRCFELFGEPSRLITLIDETVPQIFSWIWISMAIKRKELKLPRRLETFRKQQHLSLLQRILNLCS